MLCIEYCLPLSKEKGSERVRFDFKEYKAPFITIFIINIRILIKLLSLSDNIFSIIFMTGLGKMV